MSSILIRRANMVSGGVTPRLPAGYTELAYIESTGTQRLHLGISGNANFELTAQSSVTPSSSNILLCSTNNGTAGTWIGGTSNGKWGVGTSYSKYVQTWNIDSPDFVLIMLGVNDWFGQYSDELAQVWNQEMNIFIDSVHQYAQSVNKTIVIGICTNTTIIGTPNNSYHSNIKQSSRYEFLGRKNTINTFDNDTYKNQGVYVVDTGACLDSDYGFSIQKIKPFVYYEGDEREDYDNNGVHPNSAGYKQLGTCAAGFIQYIRGLNT